MMFCVRRHLFNVAVAVSVAGFISLTWLWARSYWIQDTLRWNRVVARQTDAVVTWRYAFVESGCGGLCVSCGVWEFADGPHGFPGMTVRQHEPRNLEFPFSELNSWLTPTEHFYVRSHFDVPELDAKIWRLKIEGAVERPVEISFDELRQMPALSGLSKTQRRSSIGSTRIPRVDCVTSSRRSSP